MVIATIDGRRFKKSMSETLRRVRELVNRQEFYVSDHGYDELANDAIFLQDILDGLDTALVVEDYPEYYKGPCGLVLETMSKEQSMLFGE